MRDDDVIGERLTAYLRGRMDDPALRLLAPPRPLTGGYVNRVYAVSVESARPGSPIDGELVLRVAQPSTAIAVLEREHGVHEAVFGAGYPTPEPLLLETDPTTFGAPFQLMRRAAGSPLVDQLITTPWVAPARMGAMADLLARLHALPAADLPIDGPTTEERAMARFVEHGIPGPDVCRWIDAHHRQTATTVVHLDFHALNVLFAGARPSAVLDWQNAGVGDPAHDLADARLVFLVGPTDLPAVLRPAEQVLRRGLAARLVRRYRHHRRVDDAQLRVGTVLAASRRLLGAILDRPAPGAEATGLTSPELIAALATTIERLTGVTPRYPAA